MVMGHAGALLIFLKIPEHLCVIGINAWEEFRVCASDEGHQGFDVQQ